jgi:hypothetical protein
MQLEFVFDDGNNGISVHGVTVKIGMSGLTEAQLASGEDAIPCGHNEAIARNVLKENQRV